MADKTPIRAVFNDSNVATGLAEFQSGDTIGLTHGGLGASLSIGTAGQVLKVNSGASALEFGNVEAIVNIDGATDLESQTLVAGDKILLSDGGTEGRVLLSQLDTLFSGTSKTLTNKTIALGSNTVSGTTAQFNTALTDGSFTTQAGSETLTNKTIAAGSNTISGLTNSNLSGSAGITNANLANSAVTIGSTSISLGASSTTIAGITNLTAGGINITGNSITSSDSTRIEMGEGLDITGSLTVSSNVDISGNLTVSGTTTSLETTNTAVTDNLLELNRGATNNTDDSGIIVERGSAGDNAILMWDESGDKFVVGTTTATADSNGNISHTKADFEAADVKGSTGTFTSTTAGTVLTVTGTDDTNSEGPDVVIKRNSASPADDDILGALVFKGENDADEAVTYGKVRARALDVSDSTEDGQLEFSAITNGSIQSLATLDSTGFYLNQNLGIFFEGDGADAHELKLVAADGLGADVTVTLPGATDTLIGKATTDTLTNKTISGSNNTLSNIGNSSLSNSSITIGDDSSTNFSVDLGGSFEIIGGSGITTAITNNRITLSTDGSIVTETSSDTLTNKTLTSAVLNGTISGTSIKDEDNMASDSADHLATQQSIKAYVDSQVTAQDLDFQADSGGALSIDLDSETMTFTGGTGIDTSGSGNAVTFAIDSTVATLTGTQTFTNKTLTSPKINEDVVVTATATELNYTDGVTSNIQTQLDAKAAKSFAIAQAVALG